MMYHRPSLNEALYIHDLSVFRAGFRSWWPWPGFFRGVTAWLKSQLEDDCI